VKHGRVFLSVFITVLILECWVIATLCVVREDQTGAVAFGGLGVFYSLMAVALLRATPRDDAEHRDTENLGSDAAHKGSEC
jgi:hypothetical protein